MKKLIFSLLVFMSFLGSGKTATYYVSKTGSDAHACSTTDSAGTNKLTILGGIGCLSFGDTLRVHGGTYNERITDATVISHGGGTWATATQIFPYAGETVLQNGSWGFGGSSENWIILGDSSGTWIIDGTGSVANSDGMFLWDFGVSTSKPHHIRLTNLEIRNWKNGDANNHPACVHADAADNLEIVNNLIHDCGTNTGSQGDHKHGIYGSKGANMLIGNNQIYNVTGYGVHLYNGATGGMTNAVIKNNLIHDTGQATNLNPSTFGILAGNGSGHQIYNNVVYHNGGGIDVSYGSPSQIKIWNNTFYQNNGYASVGISVSSACSSCEVKNNISYSHNLGNIVNNSGSTTLSNNLTTDPLFVNSAGNDFHIQSGSAAKDAGTNLSPTVVDDYEGIGRPQGPAYDEGAYEYHDVTPPSLTLLLPIPGSRWQMGSSQSFTWSSTGTVTNVDILESYDSGSTYPFTIVSNTPDDGLYVWTVTGGASRTVRFKIIKNGNPSVNSAMGGDMRIAGNHTMTQR